MVAPAHILDGNAGLCFAQRADDLLFDKNASSRPIFLEQDSKPRRYSKLGARRFWKSKYDGMGGHYRARRELYVYLFGEHHRWGKA